MILSPNNLRIWDPGTWKVGFETIAKQIQPNIITERILFETIAKQIQHNRITELILDEHPPEEGPCLLAFFSAPVVPIGFKLCSGVVCVCVCVYLFGVS